MEKQLDPVGGRIGPEKEDETRERDGLEKKKKCTWLHNKVFLNQGGMAHGVSLNTAMI